MGHFTDRPPPKKKILLVDDSQTIREVLKVYLMGRDYEFVEAENGERALALLRLLQVDLVIADIKMPKLDGIEFLQALRSSDRAALRAMPVILVTGDKGDARPRAIAAGVSAFLHKPLDGALITRTVGELLDATASAAAAGS